MTEKKIKEAFQQGINFAKTGKLPEIKTAEEFKSLCEKVSQSGEFTLDNLSSYLNELLNREHNYNTIAEAFIAGLQACIHAMNNHENGGITGFQHGWIIQMFLHKELGIKGPTKFIRYEDMLCPQYKNRFEKVISKEIWDYLQQKAQEKLLEAITAHPDVREHWESIAIEKKVPFGYTIGDN